MAPEYHENVAYEPDPPVAIAVRVAVWPESIVSGETESESAGSTVIAEFVDGVADAVGVASPLVPVSASVTFSTQLEVVPLGVYVSVAALESENPGQLPEATDQE